MIVKLVSTNAEETELLGHKLGSRLRGGEVIELISDLGGGKTTFIRGLARGLGSKDHVSSPTFKISNIYKAGNLELYHFDFYRLAEVGIIADELAELIAQPDIVVVVEWGEIVHDVLPPERTSITLTVNDENSRLVCLTFPDSLDYLGEGYKT